MTITRASDSIKFQKLCRKYRCGHGCQAYPAVWDTLPNPNGIGFVTNNGQFYTEHGMVGEADATVTYRFDKDEIDDLSEEDYPYDVDHIWMIDVYE